MKFLANDFKYYLHDCNIDYIKADGNALVLTFLKGIYNIGEKGNETTLTGNCNIHIVCNLCIGKEYEHITITKRYKDKIKEIDLIDLQTMIERVPLIVDNEYYSDFGKSMLLKGYFGKYLIEIVITEIEEIKYQFV